MNHIRSIAKRLAGSFQKDDLAIPVGGKHPRDTVTILDTDGDLIRFSPMGGGRVYNAPASEFASKFRKVTDTTPAAWYKAKFAIEDDLEVEGWTDGGRWNGWAMPAFELNVAKKLMENSGYESWEYVAATDTLVGKRESDPDEPDEWQGFITNTDSGSKKLYPVGAGCWIWSEVSDADKDDEEYDDRVASASPIDLDQVYVLKAIPTAPSAQIMECYATGYEFLGCIDEEAALKLMQSRRIVQVWANWTGGHGSQNPEAAGFAVWFK